MFSGVKKNNIKPIAESEINIQGEARAHNPVIFYTHDSRLRNASHLWRREKNITLHHQKKTKGIILTSSSPRNLPLFLTLCLHPSPRIFFSELFLLWKADPIYTASNNTQGFGGISENFSLRPGWWVGGQNGEVWKKKAIFFTARSGTREG